MQASALNERRKSYLLLGDPHLVSPVHQNQIGLFFSELLHLFGGFPSDPLPLRHLVAI